MQDKPIDNALLALRKQTIRGDLDGLEQVEALLTMRGVSMPRVMPAKRPDVARRGLMRLLVMDTLRGGPATFRDVVAFVEPRRPELAPRVAYIRTGQTLARMKAAGLVWRERRMWRLAT